MNTEKAIEEITKIVEKYDLDCSIAVSSNEECQTSVCMRGNEHEVGRCIIAMLQCDQFTQEALAVLGAYCIARSRGLKGFEDAAKFSEYLGGCADVYLKCSDMIPGAVKKGLS